MKDQLHKFASGAATDIGKVRSENEDSCLVLPEIGLWAVADGMGGHEAGSLASATVVDALRKVAAPDSVNTLLARCRERLASANQSLLQVSRDRGGIVIGATVAALLACDGHMPASGPAIAGSIAFANTRSRKSHATIRRSPN